MGSKDLKLLTRVGTMNLSRVGSWAGVKRFHKVRRFFR